MNKIIEHPNGGWFVYTDTRVLGPFKFRKQAIRAEREYEVEQKEERRELQTPPRKPS